MKISAQCIRELLKTDCALPENISGFCIDTRKILPGEIFVALKTASRDGHDFLNAARERGAVAALVSNKIESVAIPQIVVPDPLEALQRIARYWREHVTGTVVGVTGSVGKTSTKDLLKYIFSNFGPTHATFSNLNNTIGVPLTILSADSEENLIVEAGMSVPGELDRSAWIIKPDVAVTTNVKPAHLEGLGSMENIAREKSALARNLSTNGIAIFPAELLVYEAFKNLRCRRVAIAFNSEDFLLAQNAKNHDGGGSIEDVIEAKIKEHGNGFEIIFQGFHDQKFFLPDGSKGLAENAALAIIAALHSCVPAEKIQSALNDWHPSENRGELKTLPDGRRFFIDCYNASPASILDSAAAFIRKTAGTPNRLFVLGGVNELGTQSESLHKFVGEELPLKAETDTLAVFGGNSKFYVQGAISKGFPRERCLIFEDIDSLKKMVADFKGDVMVKGSRGFTLERVLPDSCA